MRLVSYDGDATALGGEVSHKSLGLNLAMMDSLQTGLHAGLDLDKAWKHHATEPSSQAMHSRYGHDSKLLEATST